MIHSIAMSFSRSIGRRIARTISRGPQNLNVKPRRFVSPRDGKVYRERRRSRPMHEATNTGLFERRSGPRYALLSQGTIIRF